MSKISCSERSSISFVSPVAEYAILLIFSAAVVLAADYTLDLKVNKPDGVFQLGEKATFSCKVLKDGKRGFGCNNIR